MKYRSIFLFTVSLFIGFLLIIQYQSYRHAKDELSRDSSLNYINQVNLLIQDNEDLKAETERLQSELRNLASTADANALLENEIEAFSLLNGKTEVSGPGVKIEIDLPIENFWLVDLYNELYLAGAQSISLNNMRLTGNEGFMTREDSDQTEIYLNNTKLLSRPYVLEAIGDANTLYNYLTEYNSALRRLQNGFVNGVTFVKITKEDSIKIPAAV
ncbi:MAG: DUF881 domain-containing protein [Candidatus Gracilibacteria bacterium]|nr:DUF881 domain-containing protein [Candidatus Gracilibacteria bacterium]